MWRAYAGAISLIVSLALLLISTNLPNIFAKPVQQIYKGEAIRGLRVSIPMDGEYDVMLRVSRQEGEEVPRPVPDPLRVTATRNGKQIGGSSTSELWSTQAVSFACHTFEAQKRDVVSLSVEPTSTLASLQNRTLHLIVARTPYEYTFYFLQILALRGVAFLCLALGIFFLSGYVLKRDKRSGYPYISGEVKDEELSQQS